MTRVERIKAHEAQMRDVQGAVDALHTAIAAFVGQQPTAELLRRYYESTLWKTDFAADEAGRLPPELPRGVLSEDGLFNLLEEYDALLRMLQTAGETDA